MDSGTSGTKDSLFTCSGRKTVSDQRFTKDSQDEDLSNRLFMRVSAKDFSFTRVVFKYGIFDHCYFRNCTFISCDFTGCMFLGTNMTGSTFEGCTFNYAGFERTLVDPDILDTNMPSWENVALRLARSLRKNFEGLGDPESANRAMARELNATEVHLQNTWKSSKSYYRKKYGGYRRIAAFFQWLLFKALDLLWGNGESAWKLLRAVIVIWAFMTLYHGYMSPNPGQIETYVKASLEVPAIFFGAATPDRYGSVVQALVPLTRLTMFGFFMSILLRRFSRR